MLAPFVGDLLVACTFMLLAAWVNNVVVRWISGGYQSGSTRVPRAVNRRRTTDADRLTIGEFCGISGKWLFEADHPERN
jgi:hypothetical protein